MPLLVLGKPLRARATTALLAEEMEFKQKATALCGAFLLFLCGSSALAQMHPPSRIVSEAGYELIPLIVAPSLHWIDSNRLLFTGIKTSEMQAAIAAKQPDRVARLRKLYVWDGINKSVRLYADAQSACVSNGVITYTVRVDKEAGKQFVKEGPLGSEKEIGRPLPSKEGVRSNFTCKDHLRDELLPPAPRFRRVVVLRDGDGYLDLGPGGGNDYFEQRRVLPRNLTLYQGGTGKAIQLPMTWEEEISQFEVTYSAYRSAYVLLPRMPRGAQLGHIKPWPKDQPLVVYLLWADGRTQAVTLPYRPAEYLGNPRPIRAGWIFGGGKSPKSVALYVFDGTAVAKVESGFVKEIAVSPDGCKAAVGIQNNPYEMGTPINLKVFDFCLRGR